MLKRVMTVSLLLGLAACADVGTSSKMQTGAMSSSWDKLAYVNPMERQQWGAMKALEQPGIY